MASVIVFGPTGQIGSVAALTAARNGAKVWLAMRDTDKSIPGLTEDYERSAGFERIQADLVKPDSIRQAVTTSGAKRAFMYLAHSTPDFMKAAIDAMKTAGIEFVVFLSSFTISTNKALRDIDPADMIAYWHAQVEANLEDAFGPDHYVAVRPGCFITNLLPHKDGIAKNDVKLHSGIFEVDNIVPSDIGRVVGNILVSGPRNSQNKVYLYGPKVTSQHASLVNIGKTLGKDLKINNLSRKDAYDQHISAGMPPPVANYLLDTMETKGVDKGNGVVFPNYEEGVDNVRLYTGSPAMSLEDWVKENKKLFEA